mmetsp:Transcript_19360/g.29680  ORF Transcript_19360/g.29680 Transcript_19360/m.29680 type:complete len:158 (-) Transcript_19360:576-1049(-)
MQNMGEEKSLANDTFTEYNEYVKNQLDFEEIMTMNTDYFGGGTSRVQHNEKYMKAVEREDLLSQTKLDEQRALQYLKARERDLLGLDKQVARNGFLVMDDYLTKLKIMDHPLFLFGLKLHEMQGSVSFYDADFCNTLMIKSEIFEDSSLNECCRMIN